MCTGVSQAWANSATNKVISGSYPVGGVVVGIKQSVFGARLAGLALPAVALALGWRGVAWQPHDPAAGDLLAAVFVPTAPWTHLWPTASDDHRYRVRCVSSPCTGFCSGSPSAPRSDTPPCSPRTCSGSRRRPPASWLRVAGLVGVPDGCCGVAPPTCGAGTPESSGARRRRSRSGAAHGRSRRHRSHPGGLPPWPPEPGLTPGTWGCWPWSRWFPRMRQVRRQEWCSSIPDGPRPGRPQYSAPWLTPPAPMCRVGSVSPSSVCSHHCLTVLRHTRRRAANVEAAPP